VIIAPLLFASNLLVHDDHVATSLTHAVLPAYHQEATSLPMSQWPNNLLVSQNPDEGHLSNLRQLTFGGQNAEAYWSKDGKTITYQTLQPGFPDEQIFTMNADGSNKRLVSTGKGRCTCSYFTPDKRFIYFSSTHEKNEGPQKKLDRSKGYVWMVNPDFSLYRYDTSLKTVNSVLKLNGYVAETTIDPNGKYMTFTSDKDGDLEVYRSDLDGKNIVRLTNEKGYDGGPFVSWDGKKIVWRRDLVENDEEMKDYQDLLKEHLVRPSKLEIWIMNSDGTDKKQLTSLGKASFAPFLHPDGKTVIFGSNCLDPKGREFDLFSVSSSGGAVEQITHTSDFDGFPMFSRDGKKVLFASNRFGTVRGETNIFVANWIK
jgi:TolB protein